MVHFEVLGRVAVLTIDRPEARNAIDGETATAIAALLDRVEADDAIWIGIITGAPPVFCAGADLKAINAGQGRSLEIEGSGFAGIASRSRTKPLIAAVDGPALAGGTEIVLACDMVVASRQSSFGLPEVKRCLLAAAGGVFRLPRRIPANIAMECMLTGDPIDAERAYHFGLVNHLCEEGEAVKVALQLAERICESAPTAVRETRQVAVDTALADDEAAWRRTKEGLRTVVRSADHKEGVLAFVEKRSPVWTGR